MNLVLDAMVNGNLIQSWIMLVCSNAKVVV